jgi:ketosteroid isomerase-like protein
VAAPAASGSRRVPAKESQMDAMRALLMLFLVSASLSVSLAAQTPPPADAAIRELEKAWDEAYMTRDVDAVQRLLADDYVCTNASGVKVPKKVYLMSIVKSPDIAQIKSWASENLDVRVSGNTATVTGESSVKGRPGGRGFVVQARYRFTDTWARRGGRWLAVSTVATKIR